jgi:hypothetical protein
MLHMSLRQSEQIYPAATPTPSEELSWHMWHLGFAVSMFITNLTL